MQGAKQEDLQQHRTVLPETVNFGVRVFAKKKNFGVREQAAIGSQGRKKVIFVLSLFAFFSSFQFVRPFSRSGSSAT
jgi:hypothetical protein